MARHSSSDAPFSSDFTHMHLQLVRRHVGAVTEMWLLRCNFSHHRCGSALLHLQGQSQSLLDSSRRNLQDSCPRCTTCQGQIQEETDSFALVRLWKNLDLLEQLQHLAWAVSCFSIHSRQEQLSTFHSGPDDLLRCSESYSLLPSPSYPYKMLSDQNATWTWSNNIMLMQNYFFCI